MQKKRDEEALRLLAVEPAVAAEEAPAPVMDAAESRWDPWLRALARLEAENEARLN